MLHHTKYMYQQKLKTNYCKHTLLHIIKDTEMMVCVCVCGGGGGGCFIDNRWVKLKHMLHDTKYMYQQKLQAKVRLITASAYHYIYFQGYGEGNGGLVRA